MVHHHCCFSLHGTLAVTHNNPRHANLTASITSLVLPASQAGSNPSQHCRRHITVTQLKFLKAHKCRKAPAALLWQRWGSPSNTPVHACFKQCKQMQLLTLLLTWCAGFHTRLAPDLPTSLPAESAIHSLPVRQASTLASTAGSTSQSRNSSI
jgi:hypothetical protein